MLVEYISRAYDPANIEYLIDLIDYLLTSRVAITDENLRYVYEEFYVTNNYHNEQNLVIAMKKLSEIIKDAELGDKINL